jgi:hypothetical protein
MPLQRKVFRKHMQSVLLIVTAHARPPQGQNPLLPENATMKSPITFT